MLDMGKRASERGADCGKNGGRGRGIILALIESEAVGGEGRGNIGLF